MITDAKINDNYTRWCNNLQRYGCYSERMIIELGKAIKDAPFCMSAQGGGAYRGGMLDVVLNHLLPIAYRINNNVFGPNASPSNPLLFSDNNSLTRVLLLQHISKAVMFQYQSQQWKARNGSLYEFNNALPTCMKCGERSAFLSQFYGITLNEFEYEAIRSLELSNDEQSIYSCPLTMIVVTANLFTNKEIRLKYIADEEMNRRKNQLER